MGNFSRQMRLSTALLRRGLSHRRDVAPVSVWGKKSFTTTEGHRPTIVHKRSLDILHDPWFNKGIAFSMTERDRLDLQGLLPPNVMDTEQQNERFMVDLKKLELTARDGHLIHTINGEVDGAGLDALVPRTTLPTIYVANELGSVFVFVGFWCWQFAGVVF